jgi:hypothetical protein
MMIAASGTAILAAPAARSATPPTLAVLWQATDTNGNNGGQCGNPNPTEQFAVSPNWTTPLRVDTDGRSGGCYLAFGIQDPSNLLSGLTITYKWAVSPQGNGGQCQFPGTYTIPISPFQLSSIIMDDTDDRAGYCNLTFTVSGRSDVALDIQYYTDPSGSAGQCPGALPQGSFYTVSAGSPWTISLDTDSRPGGCWLAFRLRQLG